MKLPDLTPTCHILEILHQVRNEIVDQNKTNIHLLRRINCYSPYPWNVDKDIYRLVLEHNIKAKALPIETVLAGLDKLITNWEEHLGKK